MYSLATLLAKIPDEFKPMVAVGVGSFMLVLLVLLHGAGLHGILVFHKRRVRRLRVGHPRIVRAVLLFGFAVFLMLALHIAGFAVWAYSLLGMGLIPRAYDALYFSANAYTTLGFGGVDLAKEWRNLAPIIGISGLFTFAWTTSVLVTVVTAHGELIEQLENEREQQLHLRATLLKDAWCVLKSEGHAEQLEMEKARAQAAEASFFQWFRIWRDERKRVKALRSAKVAEIAALRRTEREDEEKLGPGVPRENSGDGK
jgi:hypothetical protein